MIRGKKTITMDSFVRNILPHMATTPDELLKDYNEAVERGLDYIVIFRDYEVRIPLAEVKAHLEATGGAIPEGEVREPLDAFFPAEGVQRPETPAEAEARAIAAKHPKERPPIPVFKPGKKAPSAPEGFGTDGE